MRKTSITIAFTFFAGTIAAAVSYLGDAEAARWRKKNNSSDLYWDNIGRYRFHRNSCSLGNLRWGVVQRGVQQMSALASIHDDVMEHVGTDASYICEVKKSNSRNQIGVGTIEQLEGFDGSCSTKYGPAGGFVTADMLLSPSSNLGTPEFDPAVLAFQDGTTPSASNRSLTTILLHEVGHCLGLEHEQERFAVMMNGSRGFALPGYPGLQMLAPDDAGEQATSCLPGGACLPVPNEGLIRHYEGGSGALDLVPTWQFRISDLGPTHTGYFMGRAGQWFAGGGVPEFGIGYDQGNNSLADHVWSYQGNVLPGLGTNVDIFNPQKAICQSSSPSGSVICAQGPGGFPAATTGFDYRTYTKPAPPNANVPNLAKRIIQACPGDQIVVPVTVLNMSNRSLTPTQQQVRLSAGDFEPAIPAENPNRILLTNGFGAGATQADVLGFTVPDEYLRDPDCASAGIQAVYLTADVCDQVPEVFQDGSSAEGNNTIRTDVLFEMKSPTECGYIAPPGPLPVADGICEFGVEVCQPVCGDGRITLGEECEPGDINAVCGDYGFDIGDVGCDANCMFDASACTNCGNGQVDGTEVCDPGGLCVDGNGEGSTPCSFGCSSGETCSTPDFDGDSCFSECGSSMGSLLCDDLCLGFSTAGCTGPACGVTPGPCSAGPGQCQGGACDTTAPQSFGPSSEYYHPDGNAGVSQFCWDDTGVGQMVCNADSPGPGTCELCGVDTIIGCECNGEVDCDFPGESLSCYGEEFGTGYCWDTNAPPQWQCLEGDCATVVDKYGRNDSYCYHEASQGAVCVSEDCDITGEACGDSRNWCNQNDDSNFPGCIDFCGVGGANPTCQDGGYPSGWSCDMLGSCVPF